MKHIFVWTFDGVMGAIFVGLFLLLGLFLGALRLLDKLDAWWKRKRGA